MKTLFVFILMLGLAGGIGYTADIGGEVLPGAQFEMTWTPASPAGEAYFVERSLNGAEFIPMISVLENRVTDTLAADGDAAQYRVYTYLDVEYTDTDGTHIERVSGPTSDVSLTVVARYPVTPPGGCGTPVFVNP